VIACQRVARFELGIERDVPRVGRLREIDAPLDVRSPGILPRMPSIFCLIATAVSLAGPVVLSILQGPEDDVLIMELR